MERAASVEEGDSTGLRLIVAKLQYPLLVDLIKFFPGRRTQKAAVTVRLKEQTAS
jgi:hypothetical protein